MESVCPMNESMEGIRAFRFLGSPPVAFVVVDPSPSLRAVAASREIQLMLRGVRAKPRGRQGARGTILMPI